MQFGPRRAGSPGHPHFRTFFPSSLPPQPANAGRQRIREAPSAPGPRPAHVRSVSRSGHWLLEGDESDDWLSLKCLPGNGPGRKESWRDAEPRHGQPALALGGAASRVALWGLRGGLFRSRLSETPSAARPRPAACRLPGPGPPTLPRAYPRSRPGLRCCCDAVSAPAELGGLRGAAGTVSFLLSHRTRLRDSLLGRTPPSPAAAVPLGRAPSRAPVRSLSSQVGVQRFGQIGEAMPPPGKVPRKENLGLQCEWGPCSFVCSAMEEFCGHVTEHLQKHLHSLGEDEDEEDEEEEELLEEEFSCLWQECGFCSLDSSADLVRHVYFHCYHTKLKQWGLQALQSQADLSPCILDFHSRNIIPDIPDHFLCLWEHCESSFDNPEWFYRHVEAHSLCSEYRAAGRDGHVVLCGWRGCTCTFKDHCKLREHLRSHTQEKVVACPTCGGMFANNTKFLDHIRRQTSWDQQRFQCSHCSKRFATERLLRDHMRNHVNHYKCPLCDMTCPLPSSLRNHMRFRHSEDRPFKCDCCDYSCKNLIDLRKHLDTHSKEPAYRCDFENCSFSARAHCSLKSHYRKVHEGYSEPRYKCHVCDKCFTRGNNLTVHLRKKHQFKWPSGHPRFRYKEHEDGYMRLQLVRYESVELTQQLLRQPQEGAGLGASLSDSGLQSIILETVPGAPGPQGEAAEEGTADQGTALSASRDSSRPLVHVVNQNSAQEIVYYVLSEAPGESPQAPGSPSGSVVQKLPGAAEEPQVQMV